MSEDKNFLINLLPNTIDNAVKNITDKPTQNMGTTIADIWYLVFGDISQAAEKKKLKLSYALQKFEKELKVDISKIPEDKLAEADIQVIAQALEAAKYCIEKDALRQMFVKLISNSMNKEMATYAHPSFINIINQLSPYDAEILSYIYNFKNNSKLNITITNDDLLFALSSLEHQGLIHTNIEQMNLTITIHKSVVCVNETINPDIVTQIACVTLTKLGEIFCKICLSDH